jgi:hypothetical protein
MPITAWVISLLALVLAPIFLIRFRKRWVAAFNLAVTNRITSRFAARRTRKYSKLTGNRYANSNGGQLSPTWMRSWC